MRKQLSFVRGLIIGAAVGAGVALMLAPKTGEELRSDLQTQVESTRGEIKTRTDEAKAKLEEQRSKLVEGVKNLRKPKAVEPTEDAVAV